VLLLQRRQPLECRANLGERAADRCTPLILRIQRHPEALRCAAEFKPEIAILDLSIPLLDGYAVAERMRAMDETRDSLLVAMTGWGSATVSERVRASGFDLHLVKPVSVDRLTDALQLAGC